MSDHLSSEVLDAYVLGALDPAAQDAAEAHVAGCPQCGAALEREAQLELSLQVVARTPAPVVRRKRVAIVTAVAAVVALAAAAVLWVQWPLDEGKPRLVRCDGVNASAACVERARFDGLLSVGPNKALDVPRYDVAAAPSRAP